MKKVLIPLSGGIDSALVLAVALREGHACEAMGFDYGQPHVIELLHAQRIASHYDVDFSIAKLPDLPKTDEVAFAGRNLVFAALAIAEAQAGGFDAVAFGCNQNDWLHFPDCRPIFWAGVKQAADAAYGIEVWTPLLHMSKADVVERARALGVPIERTWSCYEPVNDEPCGKCLACKTRAAAMGDLPA